MWWTNWTSRPSPAAQWPEGGVVISEVWPLGLLVQVLLQHGPWASGCFGVRKADRRLATGPCHAALRRHRVWTAADEARSVVRMRKHLVEPVSGSSKNSREYVRFLLRGIDDATAGWTLLATAFNLQILWPVWRTLWVDYPYPRGKPRQHVSRQHDCQTVVLPALPLYAHGW